MNRDRIVRCPSCEKVFYLKGRTLRLTTPEPKTADNKKGKESFWRKFFCKK